jgi:hypothetical protein
MLPQSESTGIDQQSWTFQRAEARAGALAEALAAAHMAAPEAGSRVLTLAPARVRVLAQVLAQAEAQVQALVQAEANMWARAEAHSQARAEAEARAEAQVEVEMEAQNEYEVLWAQAQMTPQARAEAEARVWAEVWAREEAQAEAQARAQAQAEWQVGARVQIEALVKARAQIQAEVRALAQALTQVRVRAKARVQARAQIPMTTSYTITSDEILADSDLRGIIYSIESKHRDGIARRLRCGSHTLKGHWWFTQILMPINRLPTELLHRILLITVDEASNSPLVLMRVCKHWQFVVTGIWAPLKLTTRTPKDAVTKLGKNQWFLDILVDTEIDRGDFTQSEGAHEAIFAAIEASSRWRSFEVETFPAQADLPEHLVNQGLQRCSGAVMSRLRTFKLKSACETSPLLDHILHTLGTTASRELTTVEINSGNVISFLVPAYSSIFRSVTVLSLDTPGLQDPVDLLAHLHHLEMLTASRLPLPIYHNGVNLPFVHTLRQLSLRAVSIQWMSNSTFHALENCTLIFPLHCYRFRTNLPNCKQLTFEGHALNILDGVSAHRLAHLSVTCLSSCTGWGNQQLTRFSSRTLQKSRLTPRILHISITATDKAWINALTFMSALEELIIDNTRPSSLGATVLQSLVLHCVDTDKMGTTATPGGGNSPVCPSLKRFGLRYRRWLRPREQFDLIPGIKSIIQSREGSAFSLESFRIWPRNGEKSLELVEGSGISVAGFRKLGMWCN